MRKMLFSERYCLLIITETVAQRCHVKKFSQKFHKIYMKTPVPESLFSEAESCNFIKKETLAQVFSCEFCKIAKNTFSHRTPPVATSVMRFAYEAGETLPYENGLIFLTRVFLITNSLNVVYL